MSKSNLIELDEQLQGDLKVDKLTRALYATDASVYRRLPLGVAFPKSVSDLQKIIRYANANKVGVIPRTAGTSLAGQCVGEGIVVDVSKHFTRIIHLDVENKRVTVEPGVIRDELNMYLKKHGLFFGPNTSTSNRCMIGGMVGNNSSGTTSIQYGVTRDKVISMKTVLADGSFAQFSSISKEGVQAKSAMGDFEASLYKNVFKELNSKEIRAEIDKEFPKTSIHRRNTGYAVDELMKSNIFGDAKDDFNFCKLLCGSEGTLAFTTEVTLQLDDLPPSLSAMVVTHYTSLEDCLSDVVPVMKHNLHTCEMMDKVILDCTKNNREQLKNRFFVEGDPAALLMLEVKADTEEDLEKKLKSLLRAIKKSGLSYANPVLKDGEINQALELRKAGLGLLGNMVGDRKAVACIEDTAVALEDLKDFIGEFTAIMKKYEQSAVYYAHAGAGELHLRPILDLKKGDDVKLFRAITTDVAKLTKKYKGSFSGEHGDGIVRAEFIPLMIGEENYQLLRRVKSYFDPNNIFNPGKIVDAFPMDEQMRYEINRNEPEIKTLLDFSDSEGILRAAEKCNGSGDCRKTEQMAGAMCPSYHATKDEQHTTRGRANALREFLTTSDKPNKFNHTELKEAFDLCLSCKACASECPSNVDVATLKTEFLYQYQEKNGYPMRAKLFAHNTRLNKLSSKVSGLTNALFSSPLTGGIIKKVSGVAQERTMPKIYNFDFNAYFQEVKKKYTVTKSKVAIYIDEFTQYLDVEQGKDAIEVLCKLGYDVQLFYAESGRTYLSKGFLNEVKELVEINMKKLIPFVEEKIPVVGLEPSAILTFRDEYKRIDPSKEISEAVAKQCFLIEEFIAAEIAKGEITSSMFTTAPKTIKIHNHCHQKALSNQKVTFDMLNLPENYMVTIISSGCCGMAGSFGYEEEHYEVSMQVGETKLFPAIRKAGQSVIIAANGTSCRHQIKDGTDREALHPITIFKNALN